MCGCECCTSAKSIHLSLLSWGEFFKELIDQIYNAQNRKSVEMANHLFETYENYFIPHGKHMFQTEYDIVMATMCAYP